MDLRVVIQEHCNFFLDFYKEISASTGDRNAILSPVGISLALAMVAAGAGGATLDQFVTSLHLPKEPSSMHELCSQIVSLVMADASPKQGPTLSFVAGVWVEKAMPLKGSYKETILKSYKTSPRAADFSNNYEGVRLEVNKWAEDETKGIIKDLLPSGSLDNLSRLVLASALYFKGTWKRKFKESDTKDGDFYLPNGSTVKVPMMSTHTKQEIASSDSFQVLRLPYMQGGDPRTFSMYIFLPNEKNGLPELQKTLNVHTIEEYTKRVREVPVGKFMLPRFKLSSGFEVPDVLKKLGLTLPFSNEADLLGMVEDNPLAKDLHISNVFHKAFIEVNEEGTEAAAASAVVVGVRSISFPVDFVADHPFLFVIKEDLTGVIIFMGHVTNPLVE